MQQQSLFERIGGETTLEGVIPTFYASVFSDPDLAAFFHHTSKERLQKMMHEFLIVALDGPSAYTGRDLSQAHQGRGIAPRHLTLFVDHLRNALRTTLSEQDTLDVISCVNLRADAVLGRANVGG